jgi:hypothetical protein
MRLVELARMVRSKNAGTARLSIQVGIHPQVISRAGPDLAHGCVGDAPPVLGARAKCFVGRVHCPDGGTMDAPRTGR